WSVHSRRADPIKRSTRPFCQGEQKDVGRSRMPIARTRALRTAPNVRSLSQMRYSVTCQRPKVTRRGPNGTRTDMTLQWDPGTGGDTARVDVTFRRSQYAVTYHTDTSVGHVGRGGRAGAYLIAFDRQGQRWRLDFGHFRSHEQAKGTKPGDLPIE